MYALYHVREVRPASPAHEGRHFEFRRAVALSRRRTLLARRRVDGHGERHGGGRCRHADTVTRAIVTREAPSPLSQEV